jgi:hypothetical protein
VFGVGWNTSAVALRVVEDDEKGTRYLGGTQLGNPVTGEHIYNDLILQVGGYTQVCKIIIIANIKEVKAE